MKELNITLKKISDNLILEIVSQEDIDIVHDGKILKPTLSSMVDLQKPEKLHGLAERIVGVESLIFLSKQYEFLQEYLEYLVPQTNKIMLQQFFAQVSFSYIEYLENCKCANFFNRFNICLSCPYYFQ